MRDSEVVKYAMIDLLISAEVENVEKLGVPRDHTFFVKLRCITCNDISPSAVGISRDMEVEGIRGASVNMQVCGSCGKFELQEDELSSIS